MGDPRLAAADCCPLLDADGVASEGKRTSHDVLLLSAKEVDDPPATDADIDRLAAALAPIPISLGPEDPDGGHGEGRQGRGGSGRRRALEGEVAHLALDGTRVVAGTSGRKALGSEFGQQVGGKKGRWSGVVRWARGMARRRTWRAPVKLRRSGSRSSWRAAWCMSVRIARWARSSP